jgi:hypothetical protein
VSELAPILSATPAGSIEDVVARMVAIDGVLPPTDGVSCFNKLYLEVTKNVLAHLGQATFGAPSTPRAWQPLFACRSSACIAPIQFALAGMNAHINRDLPVALVETFAAMGLSPGERSPEHGDFERVNALLADTEKQVKALYLDPLLRTLDAEFGEVDDVIAMWSVDAAREAAWTNGQVLWHLRGMAPVADAYLATLDRTVGFASRGLLAPTGTLADAA